MTTIWKFPLKVTDVQEVMMPGRAVILTVQAQGNIPTLWAQVNVADNQTCEHIERRLIRTVGTGHAFNHAERCRYIGTYQLNGGSFLGHVYEQAQDD